MKKGWETAKLGEVCSLIARGIAPAYIECGGISVLNQKCIRDHAINYDFSRRHDAKTKTVNNERLIRRGDVLVNSTGVGTLGRVAQVRVTPNEPTTVDTHVTILRPTPGLFYEDFFGYMLIAIESDIAESGEGASGQTELARITLQNKFTVAYPTSLDNQKRIVSVLDKAFDGIATAKANADNNLRSAREIFQSRLNSAFARRSKEWEETTLEKVLATQPQNGWSPPAANHSDAGTPVLTLSSVTGFRFRPEKVKFTSASTDPRRNYWVRNGDFLITRSNTPELVGHVAVASGIEQPTIYPDLIMRMNPMPDRIMTDFLYYQMRTSVLRKEITGRAQGANPTMKKISNGAVKTLPVAVPPLAAQRAIVETLNSVDAETVRLASIYQRKLAALSQLKKCLLHQAFSGQL